LKKSLRYFLKGAILYLIGMRDCRKIFETEQKKTISIGLI
jgi:hypothetical protein